MKVLLLKLLLLLLFLVLLFLILRVLEGVAWYETGLVVSKIVDPLSLSVRKLKVLLDGRGISYDGVVEKQELTALMQASGDVMEGELLLLEQEAEDDSGEQSTSFSSGSHFYEEVEDKKDSIWLIQVIPRGHVPLLERETWKTVVKKVSHFGIRTGTFNCAHDDRFCRQKGWTQPILMLAMPQGLNQKDSVVMSTYPSSNHKASKVINWVSARLSSTVHTIKEGRLVKEWLEASQTKAIKPPIRLVLLSEVEGAEAPLFFSSISLKYSGRVKFGQASIHKSTQELLLEKFKIESRASQYFVTTPEGIITYGTRDGEYLNHRAMDIYLRTLYPQANDFFILSFTIGNMLCVLELVVNRDVLAKRVCHFLWVLLKYNVVLMMLWLPVLTLTQISFLDPVFQFSQKALRLFSQTSFASRLRCMWLMHSCQGRLIVGSFFMFCAVIGLIQSCCSSEDGTVESSSDWLQSNAIYFYNLLVRPNPGYTPMLMSNARLEEGMNWNRLNQMMFPNLFLLADISKDYLDNLPRWRYHQQEVTDNRLLAESDTKCPCSLNSENYRQEHCRLLQEYSKECDKKLYEWEMEGKDEKSHKKHPCRKCLGRFVGCSRGEAFLVTDTHTSGSSEKMTPKVCSDFPPPENLGCTSLDTGLSNAKPDTLAKNVQTTSAEKSGHVGKSGDKQSVECPKPDDKPDVTQKLMCDCGFDFNSNVRPTFDPWPEGMTKSSECSICLETYLHGVELCGLPCGHAFHQGCVMVWLTTNRNHYCPNCRWPAYKTTGSKLSKYKAK